MKYVLDASVAFKWRVPEVDSDRAQLLRDDFRNLIHDLNAPDIFPVELAHAFTRAERQGRLNVGDATLLWTDVMTTCPRLIPHATLIPRAIEISSQARIGIYDCLYLALAEKEACDMITADDKLVANLQAQFPFLVSLAALP